VWGKDLGRGYGPVVRQTDNRMTEDRIPVHVESKIKAIQIITEELEPSQHYSENTSEIYLESTK